ncbi:hypothetical protein [Chitinophaga nivalis]|uniref:DUF4374 domain-containing protein n=1 Tax=Chitinophaga nivalis TaxID=2991709 RepID=A0ABT3IM14_9BACT|nr:hypothetical protein [Chitinophaga nivalis]MCW3465308.1 hypothetical protein [Chitinophaga nivalis]MCW3485000.1 hypothetical protein [Chitinophaga nivalis]
MNRYIIGLTGRSGWLLLLLIPSLLLTISCQQQHEGATPGFGVIVYDSLQDADRFIPVTDFGEKTAVLPATDMPGAGTVIATAGPYYFMMSQATGILSRYKATTTGLEKDAELVMKDIYFEPYDSWIVQAGADTLLLGCIQGDTLACTLIDLQAMKVLQHSILAHPKAPAGVNFAAWSAHLAGNTLFVFNTFQKGFMREHVFPPDGAMQTLVYSYPQLELQRVITDRRTTWPGGYQIWAPNSVSLQDTVYVLGQPGGRTAVHPTTMPAILRLKTGAASFDTTYTFRPVNGRSEELYTLYDIGDGKAITKVVPTHRITGFDDYLMAPTGYYEVLDLRNATRTRLKLDPVFPDFRKNVLAAGEVVYLPVYLGNNTSRIWCYYPSTGKLVPGIIVPGRVLLMNRFSAE